jgi:hypothetical protein
MECIMARRQFALAFPVLIGLVGPVGCEHPHTLPLGPSPRTEAVASSPATVDISALQRTAAVLAADPAVVSAARQGIEELPEAAKLAQRLDDGFWARLEAIARTRPTMPVPPR